MSKVVSNKNQIRRLVELMYKNINIARGCCTKFEAEQKWEQFTVELNKLGPPARTWKKWFRVWTDLKYKTKKKYNINQEISESVSGQSKIYTLTDLEELILEIMQLDIYIDPLERVFGLYNKFIDIESSQDKKTENVFELDDDFVKSDCEVQQIEDDIKQSQNSNVIQSENDEKKSENNDNSSEIDDKSENNDNSSENDDNNTSENDDKQFDMDSNTDEYKFYGRMTKLMGNINKNLSSIANYKRKSYNLKKAKFEVYKKYIKSKEHDRKTKLELKIKVLELENEKQNMQLKIKMLELEKQKKNMQLHSSVL